MRIPIPEEEMLSLYESGWTTAQLAERYQAHASTIWGRLRKVGVKIRGATTNLPEGELVDLYLNKKLSTVEIASQYGVAHTTINYKLKEAGVVLREPGDKKNLPEAELRELYLDKKHGLDRIAEHYGVSPGCVSDYMRKYGIPVRMNNIKVLPRDELAKAYLKEKLPLDKMAERFGVSTQGIINNLDRYGIQRRGLSESHKGQHSNPVTQFKKGQAPHNRKELPIEHIAEMYQDGMSSVQIAEEFGVGHKAILDRLHGVGVQLHDSSYWMPRIYAMARQNYLANKGTKAEIVFEQHLIQCGIDSYVREFRVPNESGRRSYWIDFAFPNIKLAIELDGGVHKRPENVVRDKRRDAHLKKLGWNILRIENEWLFAHMDNLVRCLILWYIRGR